MLGSTLFLGLFVCLFLLLSFSYYGVLSPKGRPYYEVVSPKGRPIMASPHWARVQRSTVGQCEQHKDYVKKQ